MELAIPIFANDGKIYDSADYKKPKPDTITAAYEAMKNGNVFRAMVELLAGGITCLMSTDGDVIDSRGEIRELVGLMPYQTAEALALKMMCLVVKNDTVEGVYQCPRCPGRVISEYDDITGLDTRDKISELEIGCMDRKAYINEINIPMTEPVLLKNAKTGEVLETVQSFAIRYPTMNDCIIAGQSMQEGQEVRVQLKIYAYALISINGRQVDKKWLSAWGGLLMGKVDTDDLTALGDVMQAYGLKKTSKKKCPKCGKEWEAPINTSNFFASGLRPV